jgi:hypothetical protein
MKHITHLLLTVILFLSTSGFALEAPVPGSEIEPLKVIESTPEPPPRPVYLPVVSGRPNPGLSINGQVMDEHGRPVGGVAVVDQSGRRAVTDAQGNYNLTGLTEGSYALAPQMEGMVFTPAMSQVEIPGRSTPLNFQAVQACSDLIVNGGFESDAAWQLPLTPFPAAYTTSAAHSGARSVRTGILNSGDNVFSYSSTRQMITIPSGTASATLRLWLYPISGEAATTAIPQAPQGSELSDLALSSDIQYVLVLDPGANPIDPVDDTLKETLLWMRSNAQQWTFYEFDLTSYAGQTIKIQAGTFNDGFGGVTAMYVDDVAVEACDNGGVTPPPPTTGCSNQLSNSGFEFSGDWSIPITVYPAGYSTAQAHTGSRSMRTGILNEAANRYSYSDAWQVASIPSSATSATLDMWLYSASSGTNFQAIPQAPAVGQVFGEQPLAEDAQYVLILNPYTQVIREVLLWQRANASAWTNVQFDLTKYAGQTIRLQFGTYNNGGGGVTSMFVDDAILDVCTMGTSPTPTPTPTPVPGTCAEKFANNSFELDTDWGIPITAFSAGYSTAQAHTGSRSMRTGVVFSTHNRFSYSDAYQSATINLTSSSATLGMWVYPISTEATSLALADKPTSNPLLSAASGSDVQYVLLLDYWGNWIDTLLWQRSNSQTWTFYQFDLSRYAGTTVRVQFGTYNDGLNGVTAMYVDDVSLQVCP